MQTAFIPCLVESFKLHICLRIRKIKKYVFITFNELLFEVILYLKLIEQIKIIR